MGLKTYALRLDEEVYEGIKKALEETGDPDITISFLIRRYLRDLYETIPHLKKSEFGILNHVSYWGSVFKHMARTAQLENILKGAPIVDRVQAGVDDKKAFKARRGKSG
jgi:hypothetical protein